MTATRSTARDERTSSQDIELRVAADPRELPIVRALAANIAARQDFDLDTLSDLKLAVDEACAMLITRAAPGSTMVCRFHTGDARIRLSATVVSEHDDVPGRNSFGWYVLTTLADATARIEPTLPSSNGYRHRLLIELVTPRTEVTR
jgi:serine/threonine-protein kinase RsbW